MGLPRSCEVAEKQCQLFGKQLGYAYMPYREGQQLQLLEGELGGEIPSKENEKEQKEEHGRLFGRLQWVGLIGTNKSWRIIYKVRDCKTQ